MNKRLDREYYRQSALILAKDLIGKLLVRRLDDGTELRLRIVEAEAYYGFDDTACHASKGKTERNCIMFEEGGYAYVYLCYGIHNLLNIITGEKEHPEGVLIRGLEGKIGPGVLTKFMQIDRNLNREDLTKSEKIWIEDDGTKLKYKALPRVGIDYATKKYRDIKWRYKV